jgi:Na+-transporting methylmalonyl-CoA/oxaloacetate decarboxylase gamma subunit
MKYNVTINNKVYEVEVEKGKANLIRTTAVAAAPAPAAGQTAPAPVAETKAADDTELIAVIAAAIAAYESEATGVAVSPDTFVVRSIRRR